MPLAALLMQPHPKAPVLHEHILDAHCQRRADPREGIDHQPDQRPVSGEPSDQSATYIHLMNAKTSFGPSDMGRLKRSML